MPHRPEIVAPAGTPEKLKVALHFGADAVYCGLKRFSMRAFAGNFDFDQLEWALDYAHERGRKVYVTVNVLPFEEELESLAETLRTLGRIGPDAIVVGDAGVLALARKEAPKTPLHLSTQLSVTTHAAADFWFAQGIHRIVLARELTLPQVAGVVARGAGAFEAFVHGAVCIAYSGRCLLSLYWADRDPRKGACAQGCRWPYRELVDRRRPGEGNPVAEDDRGTYFFDAKDLCALPLLDRLVETGIQAFKIEGRTRSEHYVGVVTDVYRTATDLLADGRKEEWAARLDSLLAELQRPVHRGFSTHFLGGSEPGPEAYNPHGSPLTHRNDFLGKVTAAAPGQVDIHVRFPFAPGDTIEICDAGLSRRHLPVEGLALTDGSPTERARPGSTVRIPCPFPVAPQALVRTVEAGEDSVSENA